MRAIMLTEENLTKILKADGVSIAEAESLTMFLKKDYVFVSGYYSDNSPLLPWVIMPWFIFRVTFDYDLDKIKTDWDQIVRL